MGMSDELRPPAEPRLGPTGEEYRLGAKIYLVAGVVLGGVQFFAPGGGWRLAILAVAGVCLVRSGWYLYRSRGSC